MKGAGRIALAALTLLLFAELDPVSAQSKRVVVLHSFGQDFRPWSDYAKTIRSELHRQSPWQMDIIDHSLVAARSSNEHPEVPFVAYLRALYAVHPPDIVVSIGAPAANFVQRRRAELFPSVPMVLTAVDERRVQTTLLAANDTAVPVRIDYLGAIQNILQVLPDTKNVTVVVGTSPVEQFWRAEIENSVKSLTDRVSFTWTNTLSFDDVLKHAAALPPHSALFWELMIVDAAGTVHDGNSAIKRLHAASKAPIFSYDESFFGGEIVGGPLLAVLDSSRQTAAVAIRILKGEKPRDIKIPPVTFSTPKFDWREMQRWGISESRLPPGSEIHFREPTVWQRYRWQLTIICAALLFQATMITWLLMERYRRRSAEVSLKESEERLTTIQDEQRQQIAQELHDSTTQHLSALGLNPMSVRGRLAEDPKASELCDEMERSLGEATRELRTFTYLLHPPQLKKDGLRRSVHRYVEGFARRTGLKIKLRTGRQIDGLPPSEQRALLRVVQEALANVHRHASASKVSITLRSIAGWVHLIVRDDGKGINGQFRTTRRTGVGIPGMKARLRGLGGDLEIQSGTKGTTLHGILPARRMQASAPPS